ncbi:amino acid ABC transporter permease [Devosia sp.]|uniref:amino acid ABC transporter permease n=1 Tax=Devosia sp. TaxID=1871048 RepID=UPI001A0535DF|nr:amino acid ABC transporter permease [Devosia sp.]MBE0579546.1 amino acid ABC transporter permease [Devosia sp.]
MIEFLLSFVSYWSEWAPRLLKALVNTALISALGFIVASVLGVLLALCLVAKSTPLRRLASVYVAVFRGIPLLVVLFLIYFGLPGVGIVFNALTSAVIGLGLCFAAQMAEVVRAGFLAIPKGQFEAAVAVGFTPSQSFRLIILPQVLRVSAAPIIVTFVALLKDSSLASLITVKELVLEGRAIATEYFMPLQTFIWVGVLYFVLAFPLSLAARAMARRATANLR